MNSNINFGHLDVFISNYLLFLYKVMFEIILKKLTQQNIRTFFYHIFYSAPERASKGNFLKVRNYKNRLNFFLVMFLHRKPVKLPNTGFNRNYC